MRLFGKPRMTASAAPPPTRQSCPSLKRVLESVFRAHERPAVLDLGPLCGDSLVWLAEKGAKVTSGELDDDWWLLPDEEELDPKQPEIPAADVAFDLVLAWENVDFMPAERLPRFGAELDRVLRPGGWALFFAGPTGRLVGSEASTPLSPAPRAFRIVGDGDLEPGIWRRDLLCERRRHANRDVEQAIAPLKVSGIHLQRSQVREFLVQKAKK